MAAFHLTRVDRLVEPRLESARRRFESHGFRTFEPLDLGDYRGFHAPYIHGGPETFHRNGDDFIAVAGTLTYKDQLGLPALSRLLHDFTPPFDRWRDLDGHFALLVRKEGRTVLMTDFFGAFQLFHDPDWSTVSTSFLATAEALPRLRWHDQGVYEFAFNVFPLGDDTVFEEVRRVGPETQVELGETPSFLRVEKPLPMAVEDMPVEDRITRAADRLEAAITPYARHFGDHMQVPLSGGLDSRLALAALRKLGVRPHVYVYGTLEDEDVVVARTIAEGEGFPIEIFNKPAYRKPTPEEFANTVATNWEETDALTTDGGLFDNGGNAFARHARQAGGQLAVSGGCGEIFRNFFYLPDRKLYARDVARAFYARFVTTDATSRFDPRRFLGSIETKLAAAIGAPTNRPLDRVEVEQLYPRARCRAFFGREISLVGRHGAYLMPFLLRPVVKEGLRTPLDIKAAGRFEAMLLNRIDPRLARYQSAYGHPFNTPPNRPHRLEEWSTVVRPIWLRERSYALRRRLGPASDEHGGLLSPSFLGRVIDLHFPHMRNYFAVERVRDSGIYRRIATLELLGGKLADRLLG